MKNYQTNASHLVRLGVLTLDSYVTALAKTHTKTNAALDGEWKCADTLASAYYIHRSGKFARQKDFIILADTPMLFQYLST